MACIAGSHNGAEKDADDDEALASVAMDSRPAYAAARFNFVSASLTRLLNNSSNGSAINGAYCWFCASKWG